MLKDNQAIKEITQLDQIEEIIGLCKVCHIGFVDANVPYVLGFNFGYENKTVYLHCANQGRKIEILKKNNNVCVEFESDMNIFSRHETVACSWRMRYRSVMGWGKAEFVDEYDEKVDALKIFMRNYSDIDFKYNRPAVDNVFIIKIQLDTITGRSFEY